MVKQNIVDFIKRWILASLHVAGYAVFAYIACAFVNWDFTIFTKHYSTFCVIFRGCIVAAFFLAVLTSTNSEDRY